jgi:signal transduction histidine kinase
VKNEEHGLKPATTRVGELRAATAIAGLDGAGAAVDAAISVAADEAWRRASCPDAQALDLEPLVDELAGAAGFEPAAARLALYRRAATAPELLQLEPGAALDAHLRLLLALAPVAGASVWMAELSGDAALLRASGDLAATRRCRTVALRTLRGDPVGTGGDAARRHVHGLAVHRLGRPVAAVVVRTRPERLAHAAAFLEELARVLPALLERELLLQAGAARDQQLHAAAERRLLRVGFDLHDGPLQEVAALGVELSLLYRQVDELATGGLAEVLRGRIDDVKGRLTEVDRSLRELSQSLETSSLADRPLVETLARETSAFTRRTGIDVVVNSAGAFDTLSASQRIALLRIAQEALANVREHSIATRVVIRVRSAPEGVSLEIEDNGQGFDVAQTVVAAARRGRLGIVGMNERVRLLGGVFAIDSAPDLGTRITASLPAWQAPSAAAATS